MASQQENPELLFHRLNRVHHRALGEAFAAENLQDVGHPMVLFVLKTYSAGGNIPPQRELAQRLHVTPAAIAMSIKTLCANGYIAQTVDSGDARRKQISITPKGLEIVARCEAVFRTVDQRMFEGFSLEERATLNVFLQRMLNNLRGPHDEQCRCPFERSKD